LTRPGSAWPWLAATVRPAAGTIGTPPGPLARGAGRAGTAVAGAGVGVGLADLWATYPPALVSASRATAATFSLSAPRAVLVVAAAPALSVLIFPSSTITDAVTPDAVELANRPPRLPVAAVERLLTACGGEGKETEGASAGGETARGGPVRSEGVKSARDGGDDCADDGAKGTRLAAVEAQGERMR
jgi:hypothetical protein